jgi:hypothetical protein
MTLKLIIFAAGVLSGIIVGVWMDGGFAISKEPFYLHPRPEPDRTATN